MTDDDKILFSVTPEDWAKGIAEVAAHPDELITNHCVLAQAARRQFPDSPRIYAGTSSFTLGDRDGRREAFSPVDYEFRKQLTTLVANFDGRRDELPAPTDTISGYMRRRIVNSTINQTPVNDRIKALEL